MVFRLVVLLTLTWCPLSYGALIERMGGLAYFDDDLNLTWLADANAAAGSVFDDGFDPADGRMTWSNAAAWATGLSINGVTGWRLPRTLIPDDTCTNDAAGLVPWSVQAGFGYNCEGSELGHLFYAEVGALADSSILVSGGPELALFSNVQSSAYWSATSDDNNLNNHWVLRTSSGFQSPHDDSAGLFAWAVHDGDVIPTPTPSTLVILMLALAGLARGSNGESEGRKKRAIVAKKMTPEQTAEAQRLAREWTEANP